MYTSEILDSTQWTGQPMVSIYSNNMEWEYKLLGNWYQINLT